MKTIFSLYFVSFFIWASCSSGDKNPNVTGSFEEVAMGDSSSADSVGEIAGNYFIKRYDGKMDNQYPISMVLINWGDGFLSGRYWYQGKNKPISLSGELSDSLSFQIVESVDFKETGTFEGILEDKQHLAGTWHNPKRTKKMEFDLLEIQSTDTMGWSGDWHLNEVWDQGLLLIGNVTADSFDFALSIVRSSHIGTIEGQASIKGNKAFFSLKDFEDEPCKMTFLKKEGYIMVDQGSSNFACGFGARANADGKYDRKNLVKKAELAVGTDEDAILPTKILHDSFLALVGRDAYALFAFNMQLTERSKNLAPEKLDAWVVKGYVSGLVGSNEAIIMYDKQGKIWAATLDFDKTNNESLVRYFTNDPLYSTRLPLTIEEWRAGFKGYRVVFQKPPL
ncbi:MAG: hypothetical protein KDD27_09085 [Saprospiraceae bacterium]|nr:hypothetical protein [Saprospiraceae bacterium]